MHCFVLMHCLPNAIDIILYTNYCFGIPTVRYYTMVTTSYTLSHLLRCLSQFLGLYVAQKHLSHRCYTPYSVSILPNTILYIPSSFWTFYYKRQSSRSVTFLHCNITVTTSTAIICQLILLYTDSRKHSMFQNT